MKKLNINKYDMIELKNTRKLFLEYVGSEGPWDYSEWMNLNSECKAAALYCQFFNTVLLSWYKVMNSGIPVEDGISEILQYITKNVEKIENDEKRYTERYIYTVCHNCLVDLTRRRKFEYTSNECVLSVDDSGKTIFDYIDGSTTDSISSRVYESEQNKKSKEFWSLVSDLSIDAKVVIAKILDIDYDITSDESDMSKVKKISNYRKKKLSPEKEAEIMEILRERLSCMV